MTIRVTPAFDLRKILDRQVTGTDVTTIDIPNLDLDRDKRYLLLLNIWNLSPAFVAIYLFFNKDYTLANYYTQALAGSGSTVSASRITSPEVIRLFTGYGMFAVIYLSRSPDGYVRVIERVHLYEPANIVVDERSIGWLTKANVTSIQLRSSSELGIAINSRVTLFKIGG